jgi:hypothetical protein
MAVIILGEVNKTYEGGHQLIVNGPFFGITKSTTLRPYWVLIVPYYLLLIIAIYRYRWFVRVVKPTLPDLLTRYKLAGCADWSPYVALIMEKRSE